MVQKIVNILKTQGIEVNLAQEELIKKMHFTLSYENSFLKKLKKNNSKKKGFYIWGKVGRGKTLVTKAFFDSIKQSKISFHYIDFMENIHNELNALSKEDNPLSCIAKSLSKKYKIIYIDEFQVEDIADAMIIGNLLNQLIKLEVVLYLTSNAHPDDLYKDGLQRQVFIKNMKIVQNSLNIHNLSGDVDYRSRNIINIDQKSTNTSFNDKDIISIIENNFKNINFDKNKFSLNSREYSCKASSNDFIWLSFSDFFRESNGSREYAELSNSIEWIFLSDFKKCDDDSADIIRRFISFIDICHKNRTKVKFFHNIDSLNMLYHGNKLKILWTRCQSRLNEMQTLDYLSKI